MFARSDAPHAETLMPSTPAPSRRHFNAMGRRTRAHGTCPARLGRRLPIEAGPHRRAVLARRPDRPHGARDRQDHVGAPGPARDHRQQARWWRRHRHERGETPAGRWLHAGLSVDPGGHQSGADARLPLRHPARFLAVDRGGFCAPRRGGAHDFPAPDLQALVAQREGQTRRSVVRLVRQRHLGAPGRGAVRAACRHPRNARALPGRRPRGAGPPGRADPVRCFST